MKKLTLALIIVFASLYCQAQTMKIMTYNIRLSISSDGENAWPKRKDYFTDQLKFYSPDIMGIQEATPPQVTDIATALPGYNYLGIGREGVGKGESSNIFYRKDRFSVLESNTFWLSETPDTISKGWDAAYNRVCTYALFKDKKTKEKFWVFNTHLDHVGELARTKGLELIIQKMTALNTKNYPAMLMGDFNTEPNEPRIEELKKLMNDSREVSEQKPFGPSGTFNGFKHNEPVTRLIDYIFVSKNKDIEVKKYAILSDSKDLKYPSDHLPVYIELEID